MAISGVDKLDEYDTILPTIGSLAPHLCVIIEDLFIPIEVVKLSKLNALGALSLARKKFSFKMKTFYGTYLSYSLTRHHSLHQATTNGSHSLGSLTNTLGGLM